LYSCFNILLICIATLSTLLPATIAKAAAPSGLHVVGNQLEDDSNHVIVPHGVDRMGGEYSCIKTTQNGGGSFDGPVDQASVNAMLAWDVTIVRVPLNEDCWLGAVHFFARTKQRLWKGHLSKD
jgi:hypothetical protein